MQNRAARILPLYYLAMAMMLVYFLIRIKFLNVPAKYTPTISDVLANLFLLQTWTPSDAISVNTAAWSLSAEAFFYILFPVLLAGLYKKKKFDQVIIYVLLFFICTQAAFLYLSDLFPTMVSYFTYNPALRIAEFLLGNVTGLLFLRSGKHTQKSKISVIILTIISIIILYKGVLTHSWLRPVFSIYFSVLIYFIATSNGIISRLLRKKPFIYLGEISYGIYILQFPTYFFFTAMLSYAGYKINDALFFVYLFLLVIFSGLSFRFVEVPAREWLRNKSIPKK